MIVIADSSALVALAICEVLPLLECSATITLSGSATTILTS
jgi:hypothetical protein